jgi:hypothetical protein
MINNEKIKLLKALAYRQVRYTHEHSDSPGIPYEVVFTMPQWKAVLESIGIKDGTI